MPISWTPPAQSDTQQLLAYLKSRGADTAHIKEVNKAILAKIKQLGKNPGIGSPVEGTEYRVGYAINFRYAIYYKQLRSNLIKVLAVRHTSQQRPTSEELKARD